MGDSYRASDGDICHLDYDHHHWDFLASAISVSANGIMIFLESFDGTVIQDARRVG